MRILFVASNRIGDAIITCGVLEGLIGRYPGCRVTIACGPAAAGVYARMPNRERTIVFEKARLDVHWLRLWRQVAFTWWDLVVDTRGSALGWFVPTGRRVIRTRRVLREAGRMYEQHGAMLGFDPAPLPVVWTAAEDRAVAAGLVPEGAIGFGATANWAPKVWAAERFAGLYGRLTRDVLPGAVPLVFAGPGAAERAMAAPLLAALPGAVDLRGRLSIAEAAACIQRCALYVGNDSGLMHLAAASGVPTVGLCGTTLDRADEMVPAGRYADWARGDGPRMADLSVERAYEACVRVLAQAREKRS